MDNFDEMKALIKAPFKYHQQRFTITIIGKHWTVWCPSDDEIEAQGPDLVETLKLAVSRLEEKYEEHKPLLY
jgi:hypothetical protein